ncbi:nuclear transport factor 2 family protein [Longispora sp. K20-0274]|uniref:YybH family protein n=1 Tax=Longispora sp. K20-0274 TaxID=3088255 RepID=UPI0039998403
MSVESEVQQASNQFYAALNSLVNGDAGPMAEVWSHADDVSTMHPLGGREEGWDGVLAAWTGASQAFSDGEVNVSDLTVHAFDGMAYTLGVEHVDAKVGGKEVHSEFRATNIYRREDGTWKMVHHHTDADRDIQAAVGAA